MTQEKAKELLPIIHAFAEGKEIQIRFGESWIKLTKDPIFSDPADHYRIKPDPREWTIYEAKGHPMFPDGYMVTGTQASQSEPYWIPVRVREIIE